jgi:RNA polymerase subunit RPABC4/transcription elongation factor Spt4
MVRNVGGKPRPFGNNRRNGISGGEMTCKKCGAITRYGSKYCAKCGGESPHLTKKQVENVNVARGMVRMGRYQDCPNCGMGTPYPSSRKSCDNCGADIRNIKLKCRSCGKLSSPDTKFCGKCGVNQFNSEWVFG